MSALSFLNNLIPWWSFTLRLMIGVHWRYFGYRNGGEVRKPSMSLAVLCLQRRREDHKMILQHAGGVHMSHSGAGPLLAPRKLTVWLGGGGGSLRMLSISWHFYSLWPGQPLASCTCAISEYKENNNPFRDAQCGQLVDPTSLLHLYHIITALCCMNNSMLIFYINFVLYRLHNST